MRLPGKRAGSWQYHYNDNVWYRLKDRKQQTWQCGYVSQGDKCCAKLRLLLNDTLQEDEHNHEKRKDKLNIEHVKNTIRMKAIEHRYDETSGRIYKELVKKYMPLILYFFYKYFKG